MSSIKRMGPAEITPCQVQHDPACGDAAAPSADPARGAMDSMESMVNALVGWLEGILDDVWGVFGEVTGDVLLLAPLGPLSQSLALAPALSPASGDLLQLVLCAIDLHPFSWLALGIMLFSSQLIASRAQRYQLRGHLVLVSHKMWVMV